MLIEWAGPRTRTRVWGEHEFSRATGYVQAVDATTAVQMLTEPGDAFRVHPEEPLAQLAHMTPALAAEMALAGVDCLSCLASLSRRKRTRLAREMGVSRRRIGSWVKEAQDTIEAGVAAFEAEPLPAHCCG